MDTNHNSSPDIPDEDEPIPHKRNINHGEYQTDDPQTNAFNTDSDPILSTLLLLANVTDHVIQHGLKSTGNDKQHPTPASDHTSTAVYR